MRYRMLALDLDGTLNNDSKVITERTRNALLAVQEQGVIVVLASGRPSPGLKRESDALMLKKYNGLLSSYNGGRVVEAATNNILYEKGLTREMAVRLLKHMEAFPVTPIVDNGIDYYTADRKAFMVEYESRLNNLGIKVVNNVAGDLDFDPVKVLAAAPKEILLPIAGQIMEPFLEEMSFVQSTPFFLEATWKGVNKASSLQAICERRNIRPEEVIAFGDEQNDIRMLQFAGLGVAMGNASEKLKAVADEVTLSNNEDGIAHVLEKYFDIPVREGRPEA